MNDDLLISIGANLSGFNQGLDQAAKIFKQTQDKIRTLSNQGEKTSFFASVEQTAKELKKTQDAYDSFANKMLGANSDLTEAQVQQAYRMNEKIVADTKKTVETEIELRRKLKTELSRLGVNTGNTQDVDKLQQMKTENIARHSLDMQKKYALEEQNLKEDIARHSLTLQKKYALEAQAKTEDIARHSLNLQKKYALQEGQAKEDISRHSLTLQKKYALEEQKTKEDIARHSLALQKKYALEEQNAKENISRHSLNLQKKYVLEEQQTKEDIARHSLNLQKKYALEAQAKTEDIARHSLNLQKKYSLEEQKAKEDIARHSLNLQKKYALEAQAKTEDIARHSLNLQKKYALEEQKNKEDIARHSLTLQKKYALEEQKAKEDIARHSLSLQKKYALQEQKAKEDIARHSLGLQKKYALEEQAKVDNRSAIRASNALLAKEASRIKIITALQKKGILANSNLSFNEARKLYIARVGQIKNINALEANSSGTGSSNWDFAGHRGLLDSAKVVAKYGLISQALFGMQNAFRDAGAEMMRFDQSIQDNMAVLQKSQMEAKKLSENVTAVGIKYGIELDEIQKGMLTIGRAGVEETKQLMDATNGLAALSAITGDAMSYGAKAMASMLIVYPKLTGEMDQLSNKMGEVANATRLSLEDFATISNYALTASKNIGLTSDAYLILQGSMSKVGVSASSIGTAMARLEKLTLDQSAGMQNFYSGLGLSQAKIAKALHDNSEKALPALIAELGKAQKDTLKWDAATGGLDIRVRKLVNALALIDREDVYDKMSKKVKNAADVTKSAAIAAEGLEKQWVKIKNIFSEEIQIASPDIIGEFSKFIPDAKQMEDAIRGMVAGFELLVEVAQRAAVVLVAVIGVKAAKAALVMAMNIKAMTLNMIRYDIAAKRASVSMTALSVLGKMGPQAIAIGILTVAYEAWNYLAEKSVELQENLQKAINLTTKELGALSKVERDVMVLDLLKKRKESYEELAELGRDYRDELRNGDKEEQQRAQAHYEAAKREIEIINDTIEKVNKIVDGQVEVKNATDKSKAASVDLSRSVSEVAAETAKATRAAYDLAKGFRAAVAEFNNAMIGFKVASGLMTESAASEESYANKSISLAKEKKVLSEQFLETATRTIMTTEDAAKRDIEQAKIKTEMINNNVAAIKNETQYKTEMHSHSMKAIEDETKAKLNASRMTSAGKGLTGDAYAGERKAQETREVALQIEQLDKKIALGGTIAQLDELRLEKQTLLTNEQIRSASIANDIANAAEKAAEKAAGGGEGAAGGGEGAANKRAELQMTNDMLGVEERQAELAMAQLELQYASAGLVANEYIMNKAKTKMLKDQAKLARDAHKQGVKDAKNKGHAEDPTVKKKLIAMDIKATKAQIKAQKSLNKNALEFQQTMQDAGMGFVDALSNGDLSGAFTGLMTDVKDAFLEPIKEAFSELFGNTMKKIMGGFYEEMAAKSAAWAAGEMGLLEMLGLKKATVAVVNAGTGGDGYTAIARMAAVAAVVASLGFAVGGAFGGGGGAKKAERAQATADANGTPVSSTVENTLKAIEEIGIQSLQKYAKMVLSLQNIEDQSIIASSRMGSDITGADYKDKEKLGFWNDSTTTLLESGIQLDSATVAEINAGQMSASKYQVEQTENSGFWSIGSGVDIDRSVGGSVEGNVMGPISEAYASSLQTMESAVGALGVSSEEFRATSADWETSAHSLNFAGKDAEERSALIQGAISADMDRWAESMESIQPILQRYAIAGEGSGETLMRMTAEYGAVETAMRDMGKTLPPLAEGGMEVADAMIKAAGGLEKFIKSNKKWNDAFMTDGQKQAKIVRDLNIGAKEMNIQLPRTAQGMLDLRARLQEQAVTSQQAQLQVAWLDANVEDLAEMMNYAGNVAGSAAGSVAGFAGSMGTCGAAAGGCGAAMNSCGAAATGAAGAVGDVADELASLTDIASLASEWMGEMVGAELILGSVAKSTKLMGLTYDNFLAKFQAASMGGMTQDQYSDWSEMSSALQSLNDAMIEQTRVLEGGLYIANMRESWGEGGVQERLTATEKETGMYGLTPENFLTEFDKAVATGLTIESFEDWQTMSAILLEIRDEERAFYVEQLAFYEDIWKKINEAYLGSLSYLSTAEKAEYAAASAQVSLEAGDTQGYIDMLGKELEYEKKMSISKEEYIPKFEAYIEELKLSEPEKTTDDVVMELEELNDRIDDLADAIEKASFQGAL